MAQWTQVILFTFALPAFVRCSSIDQSNKTTGRVPEETVAALQGWKKRQYRYLIMTVPDLTVQTATEEKNYADFKQHLMNCPGVCFGAYDFSWQAPRGHGFVPSSEPVLFSWAPDKPREDLQMPMMKYMRLKMQMPMLKDDLKKALDNWNGAFIQGNDEDHLNPEWVVPKLRGGRMGSRVEKLNPEGKALYDQLTKELAGGSSGAVPPIPIPEEPKPDIPAATRKVPTGSGPSKPKPVKPPVGKPMTGSKEQIQNFVTQMVERAFDEQKSQMIELAKEAAREKVQSMGDGIFESDAKSAAKDAAKAIFQRMSEKLSQGLV